MRADRGTLGVLMSVRRLLLAIGAVAVAAVSVLVLTEGPAAALPGFGTAPATGGGPGALTITDVTVGHHDGYDRVVFRSTRAIDQWDVRYVAGLTEDPSGRPVPLVRPTGGGGARARFRAAVGPGGVQAVTGGLRRQPSGRRPSPGA